MKSCEVKAHLIGCRQNLGAICFWQPILSGLNLVVAAVLCDSLYVVSLLPCVADCCMLYTVCKVERFVLTIIKQRLLLLSLPRCEVVRLISGDERTQQWHSNDTCPVRLSYVLAIIVLFNHLPHVHIHIYSVSQKSSPPPQKKNVSMCGHTLATNRQYIVEIYLA